MDTAEAQEHPAGGGGLAWFLLHIREVEPFLLQRLPDPVLQRGVNHQAAGHHHQQRFDAFWFFQKLWTLQEAEAALYRLLGFVGREQSSHIQVIAHIIGRQDKDPRLLLGRNCSPALP